MFDIRFSSIFHVLFSNSLLRQKNLSELSVIDVRRWGESVGVFKRDEKVDACFV